MSSHRVGGRAFMEDRRALLLPLRRAALMRHSAPRLALTLALALAPTPTLTLTLTLTLSLSLSLSLTLALTLTQALLEQPLEVDRCV